MGHYKRGTIYLCVTFFSLITFIVLLGQGVNACGGGTDCTCGNINQSTQEQLKKEISEGILKHAVNEVLIGGQEGLAKAFGGEGRDKAKALEETKNLYKKLEDNSTPKEDRREIYNSEMDGKIYPSRIEMLQQTQPIENQLKETSRIKLYCDSLSNSLIKYKEILEDMNIIHKGVNRKENEKIKDLIVRMETLIEDAENSNPDLQARYNIKSITNLNSLYRRGEEKFDSNISRLKNSFENIHQEYNEIKQELFLRTSKIGSKKHLYILGSMDDSQIWLSTTIKNLCDGKENYHITSFGKTTVYKNESRPNQMYEEACDFTYSLSLAEGPFYGCQIGELPAENRVEMNSLIDGDVIKRYGRNQAKSGLEHIPGPSEVDTFLGEQITNDNNTIFRRAGKLDCKTVRDIMSSSPGDTFTKDEVIQGLSNDISRQLNRTGEGKLDREKDSVKLDESRETTYSNHEKIWEQEKDKGCFRMGPQDRRVLNGVFDYDMKEFAENKETNENLEIIKKNINFPIISSCYDSIKNYKFAKYFFPKLTNALSKVMASHKEVYTKKEVLNLIQRH